jgi:glycosyltransferase involved in cell wall biosynthesis
MRVALVHDRLNEMGGSDRMLLTFAELFPQAPVYTAIYNPRAMDKRFRALDIRTSFMQRLPFVLRHHQPYLPVYPLAFEGFDLRGYDLVISSSFAFAKGVVTHPETLHICYCHTPMRWAWRYEDYVEREELGRVARTLLPPVIAGLRHWDYATAARVDYFVANSPTVAARIAKYYRRESVVIPPPIETARFTVAPDHDDYFLIVSRLVSYRRIDLAIAAFNRLKLPLRVVGAGKDERRLRRMAGKNVRFLGRLPDAQMREQMSRCRAFIYPGEEDFGMAAVEAQASGRPVIAYGAGGALASVVEGSTGLFFYEPTAESLAEVVAGFRDAQFDPQAIRRHAEEFDAERFKRRFMQFVEAKIAAHPALARRAGLTYQASDDSDAPPLFEMSPVERRSQAARVPEPRSEPQAESSSPPPQPGAAGDGQER